MSDDLKARLREVSQVGGADIHIAREAADALGARDQRIKELEAELRERDDQDELWRLVRVWRTRADEEFQRAERAEAAYERAHAQANDALNRAAELQQHADQLQAALDQAQGRQTELEADNARLRSTLHYLDAEIFHAPEEIKAAGEWRTEIRTALAQQTDQPVASHGPGNLSHKTSCVSQDADGQPAQGKQDAEPDNDSEQAAVVAVEQALVRGLIRGDDEITHALIDIIADYISDARRSGHRAGAEAMRERAAQLVRGRQYRDAPIREWPEFWPGSRSDEDMVTQFADLATDAIRNLEAGDE